MITTKIDAAGRWLRQDAAASYARLRGAGCPAGGIVTAGRTYAEQARLYAAYKAGKGNLAARPGHSLHESGLAMDVTRGTDAQKWLTHGGDPLKVRTGEKLRCHAYGWYRTVPSEPWHFAYNPARDTKRKPLAFRLAAWNVLGRRFDYAKTWPTRLPLVLNRLRRVLDDTTQDSASVLVLTECAEAEAVEIGAALKMRHLSYLHTSILWTPSWTLGDHWPVENLAGTHGTLIAELHRDGRTINVVASHLPPGATPSRIARRRRLTKALHARAKGWSDPTVWGGDLNSSTAVEKLATSLGWKSARVAAATRLRADYGTAGTWGKGKRLDYLLTLHGVAIRSYRVLRGADPATGAQASDHHLITTQLTID